MLQSTERNYSSVADADGYDRIQQEYMMNMLADYSQTNRIPFLHLHHRRGGMHYIFEGIDLQEKRRVFEKYKSTTNSMEVEENIDENHRHNERRNALPFIFEGVSVDKLQHSELSFSCSISSKDEMPHMKRRMALANIFEGLNCNDFHNLLNKSETCVRQT